MKPILSVCIPTYNRCEILKDSIEGLLPWLHKKNIELCISNNASQDNTFNYLDSIKNEFSNVNIIHQPMNNGLEQNMIDAMKMAKGEYILPIGDDEKINITKLDNLIFDLRNESDLILLNGLHGNREQLDSDILGKEFIDPHIAFSFIWKKMQPGSFIVRGDILENNYYDKYIGTSHAYAGWVLEHLHTKFEKGDFSKIVTFRDHLIEYKPAEKTWRENAFKIMYYEIPLWFSLLSDNYPVIKNEGILENYLKRLSGILQLMAYKTNDANYSSNIKNCMAFFSMEQKKRADNIDKLPIGLTKTILNSINFFKSSVKWTIRW